MGKNNIRDDIEIGQDADPIVSLSVTLMLPILLGIGRSLIGRRRALPTVAETIGIAAAAAGVAVGKLIA